MYDLSSRENNMNKNKGLDHRYASILGSLQQRKKTEIGEELS